VKILFISPRYEGGIGGHAFRVAEKLREYGYNVDLMPTPHIPIPKLKNPSFTILGLIRALASNKIYDAVHAWNIPSAFIMKFIKAKKKILSVHGVYSDQVKMLHSPMTGTVAGITESKALRWADELTTDSKVVQKEYKEKLGLNFRYLAAPLDTTKFKTIPDIRKIENQVVYVGRDSIEKGIDILRKIEPQINGTVVYCTNVSWEKAMTTLKESEVLIVPSRMESLPQIIKEAFFLKVPVIATNVGGIPEIVENNITGLLVPPNDPNTLLKAVNSLLSSRKQASELSNSAYEYILKNFSWNALLPKYIELYEK